MTTRSRAGISGVLRIAVAVRTKAFATQAGRSRARHALLIDFTKDANMANTILQPDARGIAEEREAQPAIHHVPHGFSDRFALGFTKLLRFIEAWRTKRRSIACCALSRARHRSSA